MQNIVIKNDIDEDINENTINKNNNFDDGSLTNNIGNFNIININTNLDKSVSNAKFKNVSEQKKNNNNSDDICINNVDSNKHKSKNISHIKIIDNNKNIINNKSNYIKTQSNTKNNSEKTSETDSNKSKFEIGLCL